jgi:hypothetical protein
MDYGENIISTTPPLTQIRISAKTDHDSGNGEGSPGFWTLEAGSGRVPFTGAARRADYMGIIGQLGMGHRFVSGNESGAISRRGGGYSLDWWADLWDHGGAAGAIRRPWFRDLMSGGAEYFNVMFTDGGDKVGFGKGISLVSSGVGIIEAYSERLQSNFNDAVFSAGSGNSSWTLVTVFNSTDLSANRGVFGLGGTSAAPQPTQIVVSLSQHSTGDLCVRWGPSSTIAEFCTAGGKISTNTWYFVAISAKANGSGYPTITMYVGNAGTITEFGGVNMATSVTGTSGGGLTKTCTTTCATTPVVASAVVYLGASYWWGPVVNGTLGEYGLYSGVVPSHVIREIYRTLRTDWARVGRGAI